MTKQHYAKIAAVIAAHKCHLDDNGEYPPASELLRRSLARDVAAALRGTNPNYDEMRFLAACEVEP